ncbi:MAG: hypothetical protein JSS66_05790 [Armatimonadetes bacterium]|nr:hypothetical protein [Armatimonadota bacterium]
MKDFTIEKQDGQFTLTINTERGLEVAGLLRSPTLNLPDTIGGTQLYPADELPSYLGRLTDHYSPSGTLELKGIGVPEFMDIADFAYPDGMCRQYHDEPDAKHGDTLCEFIAVEVRETNDPECTLSEQFSEAARVMRAAERDCANVANAFERLADAIAD